MVCLGGLDAITIDRADQVADPEDDGSCVVRGHEDGR